MSLKLNLLLDPPYCKKFGFNFFNLNFEMFLLLKCITHTKKNSNRIIKHALKPLLIIVYLMPTKNKLFIFIHFFYISLKLFLVLQV
jgi:hypothetical protein